MWDQRISSLQEKKKGNTSQDKVWKIKKAFKERSSVSLNPGVHVYMCVWDISVDSKKWSLDSR